MVVKFLFIKCKNNFGSFTYNKKLAEILLHRIIIIKESSIYVVK